MNRILRLGDGKLFGVALKADLTGRLKTRAARDSLKSNGIDRGRTKAWSGRSAVKTWTHRPPVKTRTQWLTGEPVAALGEGLLTDEENTY